MKKIMLGCLILFFFSIVAFGQGVNAGIANKKVGTRPKIKVDPLIAEAETAWIPFWVAFTRAIKTRDKETLKSLISEDYDGGGCENEPSDKREAFFCREWKYIQKDFLGKTRLNGRYRLSIISKLDLDSGVHIARFWDSEFGEWGTYSFYYKSDGRWYLVNFIAGCTV